MRPVIDWIRPFIEWLRPIIELAHKLDSSRPITLVHGQARYHNDEVVSWHLGLWSCNYDLFNNIYNVFFRDLDIIILLACMIYLDYPWYNRGNQYAWFTISKTFLALVIASRQSMHFFLVARQWEGVEIGTFLTILE